MQQFFLNCPLGIWQGRKLARAEAGKGQLEEKISGAGDGNRTNPNEPNLVAAPVT